MVNVKMIVVVDVVFIFTCLVLWFIIKTHTCAYGNNGGVTWSIPYHFNCMPETWIRNHAGSPVFPSPFLLWHQLNSPILLWDQVLNEMSIGKIFSFEAVWQRRTPLIIALANLKLFILERKVSTYMNGSKVLSKILLIKVMMKVQRLPQTSIHHV